MKEWLVGLEKAAQELLETSLRFERQGAAGEPAGRSGGKGAGRNAAKKGARDAGKPAGKTPAKAAFAPGETPQCGTYIAVLGDANSMHLGILTTPEGRHALARGLLGMRASEELSENDAIDGMSEVMNIVAGKVKSELSDHDHGLRLGMPIYMAHPIEARDDMEHVEADVSIGPVPCRLLVFRPRKAA
jgi:hypothetical protein